MVTHILPFSFSSRLRLLSHFILSLFVFSLSPVFCMASFRLGNEGQAVDNARGGDGSHDSRNPPPFPLVEYIER